MDIIILQFVAWYITAAILQNKDVSKIIRFLRFTRISNDTAEKRKKGYLSQQPINSAM